MNDFKAYFGVAAAFGGSIEVYERIENHILTMLYDNEEFEAHQAFYDVMDRRTLNTDSLLDATHAAIDVLSK